MGQKVHPYGLRLGINKPWKSRWFVERGYDKLLVEDVKLKAELREKLKAAGVSSLPRTSRCSSRSASASAAPCASRSTRRSASAARASRSVSPVVSTETRS